MKEVFETKEAQELIINKNNLKGVRSAVFKIDNLFLKNPDIQMPPHYGEHTIEICRNILKMPDENIKNLINNKVLHCYESVK